MKLTWNRVFAWRMRRQFLDRPMGIDTLDVVRRLCGVQAQVASSAALAVAVRLASPVRGDLAQALSDRKLVKTWAMRGTLHVLPADDAAAYLSLLAATKAWESAAWQRAFVDLEQLAAITQAACAALDGKVLNREELTAEIVNRTGDPSLGEQLSSGWGAVLKPLAWQGYLCHGPSQGNRVSFTRLDTWLSGWQGLPEPDEAARMVLPAYLAAHGPGSIEVFDQWLTRGRSKKALLRDATTALVESGVLVKVDVEGMPAYARACDVDAIATALPFSEVRLLPAFDQYVLGAGTNNTQLIPAHRHQLISRTAGWISPVVVAEGRVAGTWDVAGTTLQVVLFKQSGPVPHAEIETEAARIGTYSGTDLTLSVRTD
ncbi:MAG: AlkZ family DNA glycosylase [Candidatus Dormibacteraeota bacterium]|uniref:AlkZ family DNA glycosylase n=1 Tax=Candidatus Dormiibacter inghamiae TaxID=3127013 RepID=A0A934KH97_9BACT|nr:AlkZ family DNA glycosylase [Candidatus Dormibacteraeota bacterium]MBJ7605691.1 AlkZ family DNA glycosylase [Candidatus Dormibacteraeota bacterium]